MGSSSDSENERENVYQPVYAQSQPNQQAARQQGGESNNRWPQNAVSMYSNELFTDGDVLGGPNNPNNNNQQHQNQSRSNVNSNLNGPSMSGGYGDNSNNYNSSSNYSNTNSNTNNFNNSGNYNSLNGSMSPTQPYGAQKIAQQRSTLASRRAERMQANIYEPSDKPPMNPGIASPRSDRNGFGSAPGTRTTNLSSLNSNNGGSESGGYGNNNSGGGDGDGQYEQDPIPTPTLHNLASSYDPNEGQEPPPRRQMSQRAPSGGIPAGMSASGLQHALNSEELVIPTFLNTPGPKMGPVLCYIVRDKGNAKMYPKFSLYLKDGNVFLLAGRKRKKATASNYVLSLDQDDLGRGSDTFFGKLRANFVGTEFTIFDNGEKAGKKAAPSASNGSSKDKDKDGKGEGPTNSESENRQELGCVTYQYNVLGTRGPRKMTAVIPALDPGGQILFQPDNAEDTMIDRFKAQRGLDELVVMKNKPPRWNDELNAYCLNFNGRVTEASVKNFQLASDDNINHVILQFGKVGKDRFNMDYQWPITPLQAFAICLSSFDNKLACE